MTDGWTVGVIVAMAVVTLISRCFFFILDRQWMLPAWAERALHYAPVAALAAVVAPEILTADGRLIGTWHDARLFGAALGTAVYFWRRSVLLTLAAGMLAYLPLHIALRW
ncbi:MAG TPA: AzlD domain-containing protein [Ramlibacter sp.]|uniref:AzlD domain-containing protein n=1 Tax=Ramlibacter sp. TaxID=1917967 RepID=UPI002C167C84|nr:AzlD domain-containing protein [Ramlibacter sp.]HVZ47114.1 AzlD domain-containing protein [Ramlibacter sp.]